MSEIRPTLEARNPRTGEMDYRFVADDPHEAASTLRSAQADWEASGLAGRADALGRLADAIIAGRGAIVEALSEDTGRVRISEAEVDGVVGLIRGWCAQVPMLRAALEADAAWTPGRARPGMKHRVSHVPYPVVGVISPWNFPVTLSFIDTIPALLAGCTVMVKPSEVTPRFVEPMRAAVAAAGLQDVLRFVRGAGSTGAQLVAASDCICFTGSVATGRKVAMAAAECLIPANLELGGKDPMIVLPGADMAEAARIALRASVLATGQACQSIERVLVPTTAVEGFVATLARMAEAVPLNILDEVPGGIGPFIFAEQAETVAAQVNAAVRDGATLHTGGEVERHNDGGSGGGHWMRPTVLSGVRPDMAIMREETFGPVIPVIGYKDLDEAVEIANGTEFGLSAAVFGPDIETCEAVAARLEAGAISLMDAALTNQYFEAPKQSFKASGLGGSRMGLEGFHRFLRKRALIANTDRPLGLEAW